MIENLLKSLDFDQEDVKIYLFLLEMGSVSAGMLAKRLGVPRSSLYGFLKRLEERGLIIESQKHGVKSFSAENPEKINLLFSQQIEVLQKNQTEFKTFLPNLKRSGEKLVSPKFQIFEGQEGLQNALKDILLYYNIETQAFWPQKKMIDMLTPEFFRYHNKERIKNNLYTRAIWPQAQMVEVKNHPYFGAGKEFKREIRIAPPSIDFTMGYWIYGNKTVFISSRKESFGFIVESLEFAQMLISQFEVIWNFSKQLVVDKNDTVSFLQELRSYNL